MPLDRIIISGGGTGGHIYPALAIADEIRRRNPNCEILFVGAIGRMEMEKVPQAGYRIEGLDIAGLERKIFSKKNLGFLPRVIRSVRRSKQIIKDFNPQAAIGVGGYASGPLLFAATKKHIATLIQEQNSYPGITNKILSKRVDCICTGFEEMSKWFPKEKTIYTGNPLRNVFGGGAITDADYKEFGLEPGKKTLFVMGGSLGAKSLNDAVRQAAGIWKDENIQVLWQTGTRFLDSNTKFVAENNHDHLHPIGFISSMNKAYGIADIIVSRAGAMSIAELAMIAKPTILVPSPHVAEDHQTHNAKAMTDSGAALLIKDADVVSTLGASTSALMRDEDRKIQMRNYMQVFAKPQAAATVVDELQKLLS
jgi:UDP-N-acetylglucosamine--N-acetylmuramyl-(pentapeptide) pyrophosphoryl-undecaprenol N-acetylglucosamine transferase